MEKFNLNKVLEAKEDTSHNPGVGEWSGDNLIVRTYPLQELVNRIIQVGYVPKLPSLVKKNLNKVLPKLVKTDRNYIMTTIDILNDEEIEDDEKADLIDQNVDEFVSSHKELNEFLTYKRK